MDTDEGPLINENSNGLSHLLTESEFNSVDAVAVDESSVSNQGFLNAVELSADSVGDYLENNTDGFNTNSFDVGDNAVTFPSDSLNNVLSDGDSRLSDSAYNKAVSDLDGDVTESQAKTEDFENETSEISNDAAFMMPAEDSINKTDDESSDVKIIDTVVIEDDTSKDATEVGIIRPNYVKFGTYTYTISRVDRHRPQTTTLYISANPPASSTFIKCFINFQRLRMLCTLVHFRVVSGH